MIVAIIEDEPLSAEKLERCLLKYDPEIEVLHKMSSVEEAIEWLGNNQPLVDLVFMDIQLSDRLCFEIFDEIEFIKPVIFTTAYDEYALEAFKVNSIDYILKPVTFKELSRALKKIDAMRDQLKKNTDLEKLFQVLKSKTYKERFIVKTGNHLHSLKTSEIGMFYAEGRTLYLLSFDRKKSIVDFNLQDLEDLLDPAQFFRVNRSYILNINAIKDVVVYSNSRLKIKLDIYNSEEIIVSRERVADFKLWFAGE